MPPKIYLDANGNAMPAAALPKPATKVYVDDQGNPLPAQQAAMPRPPQRLSGVGIQTVSDEEWSHMAPAQRAQGLLKAAGYGLASILGMGEAGRDAVDRPAITLATAAVPIAARGVRAALPSKVRAGEKFQEVMGAARNVPVDISLSGNQALRIMQLSERGATLPKVVRDFLKRVTDPNKGPLVYEEARDFASNISRLSADEFNRLNPALRRELGTLRVSLNTAVEQAAASVGKGETYLSAMREYAQRSKLDDIASDVWTGVKHSLPWVGGAGLGAYGLSRMSDLLRPE